MIVYVAEKFQRRSPINIGPLDVRVESAYTRANSALNAVFKRERKRETNGDPIRFRWEFFFAFIAVRSSIFQVCEGNADVSVRGDYVSRSIKITTLRTRDCSFGGSHELLNSAVSAAT